MVAGVDDSQNKLEVDSSNRGHSMLPCVWQQNLDDHLGTYVADTHGKLHTSGQTLGTMSEMTRTISKSKGVDRAQVWEEICPHFEQIALLVENGSEQLAEHLAPIQEYLKEIDACEAQIQQLDEQDPTYDSQRETLEEECDRLLRLLNQEARPALIDYLLQNDHELRALSEQLGLPPDGLHSLLLEIEQCLRSQTGSLSDDDRMRLTQHLADDKSYANLGNKLLMMEFQHQYTVFLMIFGVNKRTQQMQEDLFRNTVANQRVS